MLFFVSVIAKLFSEIQVYMIQNYSCEATLV